MLGIAVEPSYGIIDGTASIYSSSPDCGSFTSGSFSSTRITALLSAPSLFSSRLGLSLRPGWNSSVVRFALRPDNPPWVFDADKDQALQIEREFRLEASSQSISLSMIGTYRIGERIMLGVGPDVGYRIAQSIVQTDHILGPGETAFPDGQTSRPIPGAASYSMNPWVLGVVGAGAITLPVGKQLSFWLEGSARADLLSPVREAEWKGFSVGGNLGLVFTLEKDAIPPPSFPAIVEPVLPPAPALRLSAAIEVYGLEGERRRDTITSRFREKDYCRSVRYVPQVLFAQGASELPPVYARNSDEPSSLPTFDSLSFYNPIALQERALDVVALRLLNDSESTLLLHPAGADAALGQKRGEQVQAYLRDVWGVAPERVAVGDPVPGSRLVEGRNGEREGILIESSSPAVTAPVVNRRLYRDFEAPLVKVATSHEADAGLRAWEVLLTSRDKTIARYSSEGSVGEGEGSMNWNMVYDEGTGESATVEAVFTVEDSLGTRKSARGEAMLLMLRSRIGVAHGVDMEKGIETLLYQLSPSSATYRGDSLGRDDILRTLERDLHAGASVWIVERGGESSAAAFRDGLNGILRRHSLEESAIITERELREILNGMEKCLNPDSWGRSSCVVVVRQNVE